jgi:hypothetical protein
MIIKVKVIIIMILIAVMSFGGGWIMRDFRTREEVKVYVSDLATKREEIKVVENKIVETGKDAESDREILAMYEKYLFAITGTNNRKDLLATFENAQKQHEAMWQPMGYEKPSIEVDRYGY